MRRAFAILALVSLLAVPLAAWPKDEGCCCGKDCCKNGICPMRAHRAAKHTAPGSECGLGIQCECPTQQSQQMAPAPPGVLIAPPVMPFPENAETATACAPDAPAHGFVSPPFQPPRLAA